MDSNDVVSWFKTLSNNQKCDIFGQFFENCPAFLQMEIKEIIELKLKRDFISNVPQEVAEIIFTYLGVSDLAAVQVVCKRWRNAVNGPKAFYQRICERLDVEKSEYETPERAIAICRHILQKESAYFEDWFSMVQFDSLDLETDDDPVRIFDYYESDSGFSYVLMVTTNRDQNGSRVQVAKVDDELRNGRFIDLCDFRTTSTVSYVKFFNEEAIFCGTYLGIIERWNIRGESMINYFQHAGAVFAVDVSSEVDLMFTGGADRSLFCWRLSTAELLCVYDSFNGWVLEIKLKPVSESDSSLFVAVLSEFRSRISSRALSILSCSNDGRQLRCSYNINWDESKGVLQRVAATKDGFRFMQGNMNDSFHVCHYFVGTGEIRRTLVMLDEDDDHSRIRVEGFGTKYYLVSECEGDSDRSMTLVEKQGGRWTYNKLRFVNVYVLGNTSWLNGIRPENTTKGLAFVGTNRDVLICAFWK